MKRQETEETDHSQRIEPTSRLAICSDPASATSLKRVGGGHQKWVVDRMMWRMQMDRDTDAIDGSYAKYLLWEPYPSYHNGLFSPLLVLEVSLPEDRSISVLSEQYKASYLFYVTIILV